MKVFLNYEDNENKEFHKALKITLPKSWKTGPVSNLLNQFVESYNAKFQDTNPLQASELHLGIREQQEQTYGSMGTAEPKMVSICNDAVVIETIPDRSDVYICHGPGRTKADVEAEQKAAQREEEEKRKNTVACTHFGCQNRFPKGGPYPECRYHRLPPVFHETAKYWACCPNKKAYGKFGDCLVLEKNEWPGVAGCSLLLQGICRQMNWVCVSHSTRCVFGSTLLTPVQQSQTGTTFSRFRDV